MAIQVMFLMVLSGYLNNMDKPKTIPFGAPPIAKPKAIPFGGSSASNGFPKEEPETVKQSFFKKLGLSALDFSTGISKGIAQTV
jgi:hypothetical protein